ncbi:BfmA/BtgA family mobilization protein [Hymenobacter rigui]|uniref:Uncharacterized protein n=1 Tax=Hymenobacter rigui TaxID=334424 RepID=A0A3R9MLE0_9BACT|nr:BfmA/BtgA family mobilization protein [Hymenobacter rigui]RSK43166.1 hypothetical protein EI291_22155 [Hymenobacter rigui]
MERPKRKAGRPREQSVAETQSTLLRITSDTDRILAQQAKKLKMSKGKYASAAIAYFAENGLDPTKAAAQSFAHVTKTVAQEARSIRVQNVDIGNRLIAIIRTFEKSLYGFMQQQQGGSLNYLEQIESGILRHQVALETNYLMPLVEMLVQTNVEANTGRTIGEHTNLAVTRKNDSDWAALNKAFNEDRDQKVVVKMREFIKNHNVPVPTLAPKPAVPAVPPKAPVAPAAAMPEADSTPK